MKSNTPTDEGGRPRTVRRAGCFTWCCRLGFLVVLALLLGAYFARGRLTTEARRILDQILTDEGYHLVYENPRYSPIRGLVVSNVKWYKSESREQLAVEISDCAFSIGIQDLLHRRKFGGEISSRNATVHLYNERGSPVFTDVNFNARIGREATIVNRLNARFGDLQLNVFGRINKKGERRTLEERRARIRERLEFPVIPTVSNWLQIKARGEAPVLDLVLSPSGNADKPVEYNVHFHGRSFVWRKIPLESADIALHIEEDRIEIRHLQCDLLHGRTTAAGLVRIGDDAVELNRFSSSSDLVGLWQTLAGRELPALSPFKFDRPPTIRCDRVQTALAKPLESPLLIEGSIESNGFTWRERRIESLATRFSLTKERLNFDNATVTLPSGPLTGGGNLDLENRHLQLGNAKMECSPVELFETLGIKPLPFVEALHFDRPPAITARDLAIDLKAPLDSTEFPLYAELAVQSGPAKWRDLGMEAFTAQLALDPENVSLSDVQIKLQNGGLRTSGSVDVKRRHLHLVGVNANTDPLAFLAAIGVKLSKEADRIEFTQPPMIETESFSLDLNDIRGSLELPLEIHSRLSAAALSWRDMEVRNLGVDLTLNKSGLAFAKLEAALLGGTLETSGSLPFEGKVLELAATHADFDLLALFRTLSDSAYHKTFQTAGNPSLTSPGFSIDLKDSLLSTGSADFVIEDGIRLKLGDRTLPATKASGRLVMDKRELHFTGLNAKVLDGTVTGDIALAPGAEPFGWRADLNFREVPLASIGRWTGFKDELAGVLDLNFDGGGGPTAASMGGEGSIIVSHGRFYTVPLFGPLHIFLRGIAPALGRDVAKDLTCTFRQQMGILSTRDLEIVSKTTRIKAKGAIDTIKNQAEFDVTANFRGPVGLATGIVSKILEIRGEGTMEKIEYRLRRVPRILPDRPRIVPRILGSDKDKDKDKESGESARRSSPRPEGT